MSVASDTVYPAALSHASRRMRSGKKNPENQEPGMALATVVVRQKSLTTPVATHHSKLTEAGDVEAELVADELPVVDDDAVRDAGGVGVELAVGVVLAVGVGPGDVDVAADTVTVGVAVPAAAGVIDAVAERDAVAVRDGVRVGVPVCGDGVGPGVGSIHA